MAYTHITRAQAKTQLASLLQDPNKVFWSDSELGLYIEEALRTWSAHTGYWRDRASFTTMAATAFYDLTTKLSGLRGLTVTDQNLVSIIQHHLLEPSTGSSWTGSDQFNLSDVTEALQRRRNELLLRTGIHLTRSEPAAGVPPVDRVALSDSIIEIVRLAWKTTQGYYSPLWRTGEFELTAGNPEWPQQPATVPQDYSVLASPPLTVQLAPPASDIGSLEIVSVNAGAALDPATGVTLGIPDDFAWVVKWGALADLLGRDGQSRDWHRAAYCEQRWREGLAAAESAVSVMQARVDGRPIQVDSLYALDAYDLNWENKTGAPSLMGIAGLNLVAFRKVPDAVYSVTLDTVRNAPIPSNDAAQIQIGREELEAVLGYAQHLAAFKMGGAEFDQTKYLYANMLNLAADNNARLIANATSFEALIGRAIKQKDNKPHRKRKAEVA